MGVKIVDALLSLLTILFSVLILLGLSASFIPPSLFLAPSFVVLSLPLMVAIQMMLALYWLLRWRRKFWYALFILLLAGWQIPALWAFNPSKNSNASLRVATYNVHGAYRPSESRNTQLLAQKELMDSRPHVVVFQEFNSALHGDVLSASLPHHIHRGQLALYSKWPIVRFDYHKFSKDFNYGGNAYLWVDVESPKGTVRIFNFHLASIQLGSSEYLLPSRWADLSNTDSLELRGKSYFPLLAKGFRYREQQQEVLLKAVQESPFPVLVCGDLNDVPGSYAYWKFAQVYPDAFRQAGWGRGRTYHSPLFPLRIDYVFNGTPWRPVGAEVLHLQGSDHDPLLIHFTVENSKNN